MDYLKHNISAFKEVILALKIKFRVIFALILRETRTTFGNSSLGYIWALFTPAMGVTLLVALFTFANRQPPFGQSLALFFSTGYLVYDYWSKLTNSLSNVLDANKALLLYPVVTPTAAILSRFILITITYILVMFIFFAGLIILGLADFPAHPIRLSHAFFATSLVGLGLGVFNCSIIIVWESWRHIYKIITRPLFFISGIFFIPSLLTERAIDFLKWNPVLHLIEWFRNSYYQNYDSRVLDKVYIISLGFILIALGFLLERYYRSRRS
jgi:capsular polysaccharide transport system permease protein